MAELFLDEYVYNWGDDGPGGCPVDAGWKTFDQIFSATLTSLSNTHPTKPFMLGEFASVEGTDPMSKANWITDAYNRIELEKQGCVYYLQSSKCVDEVEHNGYKHEYHEKSVPFFFKKEFLAACVKTAC